MNRRLAVRPNVFICLLTLLVIAAFLVILGAPAHRHHLRDLPVRRLRGRALAAHAIVGSARPALVRSHLTMLLVVLGTLLSVSLPNIPVPSARAGWTAHSGPFLRRRSRTSRRLPPGWWSYCGSAAGCPGGFTPAHRPGHRGPVLLVSHTRTALVGMPAGILVAGLSLFKVRARARKLFVSTFLVVSIGAITLSGFITTWLARGENSNELGDLTGRTNVWARFSARSATCSRRSSASECPTCRSTACPSTATGLAPISTSGSSESC